MNLRRAGERTNAAASPRSAWFWASLTAVAVLVSLLLWLNRSPWWGWTLVAGLMTAFVVTAP